MGHKCFISFKMEDVWYKNEIQKNPNIDMIDKSLNVRINSNDPDYVMSQIRKDYLSTSTVTIHIIGINSGENKGEREQEYIKRELQGSLYHRPPDNTRNGILGVVTPAAYNLIFKGKYNCQTCGNVHDWVTVEGVTIKEFSYNYHLPNEKCAWWEDDRYCILVKWDDFIIEPNKYIDAAYDKRSQPIANKIRVYP